MGRKKTINAEEISGAGLVQTPEEIASREQEKVGLKVDAKPVKPVKKESVLYYYWVKVKSYVNREKLVYPSLYYSTERVGRFFKAPANLVEAYEGEIPDAKVYEIAKIFSVKISQDVKGKVVFLPVDEILGKLAKQL